MLYHTYVTNQSFIMVRISFDRKFCFGKYKGQKVDEIIDSDTQYIEYLCKKLSWLFTDEEKQKVRNIRNKQRNKDICSINAKCRTPFEEEMYRLINRNKSCFS